MKKVRHLRFLLLQGFTLTRRMVMMQMMGWQRIRRYRRLLRQMSLRMQMVQGISFLQVCIRLQEQKTGTLAEKQSIGINLAAIWLNWRMRLHLWHSKMLWLMVRSILWLLKMLRKPILLLRLQVVVPLSWKAEPSWKTIKRLSLVLEFWRTMVSR